MTWTTDPGATESGATDPGATESGATDPGATNSGATEPGAAESGATTPGTAGPRTVAPRVIVLNGGSSAGKSTLARALQDQLPQPWLAFSIDDLVAAMPERLTGVGEGIDIGDDGQVGIGPAFRELEAAWLAGLAASVRAGARVVLDDVFLGGAATQQRLRAVFDGLPALWAGVHCDAGVAAARERLRGDRTPGMAASQAAIVHRGVAYDVEVDTAAAAPADCAAVIAARLRHGV